MFPSNSKPTISRSVLMTGDPEFPPIVSDVPTKLSGVDRSKLDGGLNQEAGRSQSVPAPYE